MFARKHVRKDDNDNDDDHTDDDDDNDYDDDDDDDIQLSGFCGMQAYLFYFEIFKLSL